MGVDATTRRWNSFSALRSCEDSDMSLFWEKTPSVDSETCWITPSQIVTYHDGAGLRRMKRRSSPNELSRRTDACRESVTIQIGVRLMCRCQTSRPDGPMSVLYFHAAEPVCRSTAWRMRSGGSGGIAANCRALQYMRHDSLTLFKIALTVMVSSQGAKPYTERINSSASRQKFSAPSRHSR